MSLQRANMPQLRSSIATSTRNSVPSSARATSIVGRHSLPDVSDRVADRRLRAKRSSAGIGRKQHIPRFVKSHRRRFEASVDVGAEANQPQYALLALTRPSAPGAYPQLQTLVAAEMGFANTRTPPDEWCRRRYAWVRRVPRKTIALLRPKCIVCRRTESSARQRRGNRTSTTGRGSIR
jgi:hypothetical protein